MKRHTLVAAITRRTSVCVLVGCAGAQQARIHDDASAPPSEADAGEHDSEGALPASAGTDSDGATTPSQEVTRVRIAIERTTLSATLSDNATARAFRTMLPLTLEMADLNANEKHGRLPSSLPMDASNPITIQAGDLMLYGSNTLVLFYKTFATSYDYTPLGRVDDPSALAAALSAGDVTVTFQP